MDENDYWVHVASPHWQSKISFPKNVCHSFSIRLNASLFYQPQVNHHLLYNFKPRVGHLFGE
jgi:hypothetical protein